MFSDMWRWQKDEEEAKVLDLSSKVLYEVDLEFSEEEKFAALRKLTTAATKYDPSHAAAVGLDAFERKTMSPGEFKEIVRRTFHLKLLPREVGAIFDFFSNKDGEAAAATGADVIDCGEFLRYFIHLGITERAKVKSGQIEVITVVDEVLYCFLCRLTLTSFCLLCYIIIPSRCCH